MSMRMRAKMWLYQGNAAWHFVTLPKKQAHYIKGHAGPRRGWGSVRVSVTIGKTSFKTSIFPDSTSGSYVLPIKKEVRKKEGIKDGDTIIFTLQMA